MTKFLVQIDGKTMGPHDICEITELYRHGLITLDSQATLEGEAANWKRIAEHLPSLARVERIALTRMVGDKAQLVSVTDVDMKFLSMVWFMVKWAFAAIPAMLIVSVSVIGIIFLVSFFAMQGREPGAMPNVFGRSQAQSSQAQKNGCIWNLRVIDGAIEQFALEAKKRGGDPVTVNDLPQYLAHGKMPTCPTDNSAYSVTVVAEAPTCPNAHLGHVWNGF